MSRLSRAADPRRQSRRPRLLTSPSASARGSLSGIIPDARDTAEAGGDAARRARGHER